MCILYIYRFIDINVFMYTCVIYIEKGTERLFILT